MDLIACLDLRFKERQSRTDTLWDDAGESSSYPLWCGHVDSSQLAMLRQLVQSMTALRTATSKYCHHGAGKRRQRHHHDHGAASATTTSRPFYQYIPLRTRHPLHARQRDTLHPPWQSTTLPLIFILDLGLSVGSGDTYCKIQTGISRFLGICSPFRSLCRASQTTTCMQQLLRRQRVW